MAELHDQTKMLKNKLAKIKAKITEMDDAINNPKHSPEKRKAQIIIRNALLQKYDIYKVQKFFFTNIPTDEQ